MKKNKKYEILEDFPTHKSQHNPNDECCICERVLGNDLIEWHHLVPKTFKGKALVPIHKICHRKIHATFSERELEKVYFTPESLRENESIAAFVAWVKKKPSDYYDSSATSNRKRN
jgi:hypothetical protein